MHADRRRSKRENDHWLTTLEEIYRDADDAFATWSCSASTECCRFGLTGREPYVTSVEVAAIHRAVAALGGVKALRARRGTPAKETSSPSPRHLPVAERRCPLLSDDGRCAIYEDRPLGCRTFFCDRAESGAPVRHKELLALVRRVQELAAKHQPGGDQGRPLTRILQL
ncbi:YkgJ family cysteine cluster protein [Chondromyces crocatus]|uniref:YkgJ family cysteine cluster protein n=1 Tax=Chondromyces crocatus TaxID=52 RepID=UPI0009EA126D